MTSLTISSVQDLIDPFTYNQMGLKPKQQTINEDLLAISACLYRQFKNTGSRFTEFNEALDLITVTDSDRAEAELIADHFDKQIVMTLLNGRELSKFQDSLNKFLTSDRRSYTSETKGMIYRLPEFYEYDNDLTNLVNEHYSKFRMEIAGKTLGNEMVLKPIMSLTKNLRSGNKKHYWLKEVDNNIPVMLQFKTDNPLLYMWEHMFNTRSTITIGNAAFVGKNHPRGLQYATSDKWEMKDI